MLYEVRDCCNDFITMISNLEELEEIKQNHPCYKRIIESLPCGCGYRTYGSSLELYICQIDDDEAYEKAVEYYQEMESLSFQWEQACIDDPELLDK